MNETLSTFMKIAFTMVILTVFFIGICYQALQDKNCEFNQKVTQYQIKDKEEEEEVSCTSDS